MICIPHAMFSSVITLQGKIRFTLREMRKLYKYLVEILKEYSQLGELCLDGTKNYIYNRFKNHRRKTYQ
jgi:hypothetical protein